jgi:hypothetical protein
MTDMSAKEVDLVKRVAVDSENEVGQLSSDRAF